MQIEQLLKRVLDREASDLHIRVPSRPVLRIHGKLVTQVDLPPVTDDAARQILDAIITPRQAERFEREKELDFAYDAHGVARFRVNVMKQRGHLSIAFRLIPLRVPAIDELGLPQILKKLVMKPRGLILVTGQTGTGKSTTLAAMINHLNNNGERNIITIEEPLEFIHENHKCLIAQREVGLDTESFANALVHALRHDPDVLVVGELRDLPTIATAITAAETGHLVLGTLHTFNAPQTIDRMIDIFPSDQQIQIRIQLSQITEAVLSQTLLPRVGGGRVAAFEIMVATSAVRNLIRERKVYQLPSVIQLGGKDGMQSLDQSLATLAREGVITRETALAKAIDVEQYEKWYKAKGVEVLNQTSRSKSLAGRFTFPEIDGDGI
ncbi:MAG: type IV pilus twitching motility protein PilT [Dehalococcoidales bacterium]|nr:type IV pilus twitching motility protein PilT [Dehalococcoidales bacterium]